MNGARNFILKRHVHMVLIPAINTITSGIISRFDVRSLELQKTISTVELAYYTPY